LAQAFLLNNEPKSSKVCLVESAKIWDEVSKGLSAEEKSDCEQLCSSLERKTRMEKENVNVIGNINEFAFLKSEAKPVKAAPVAKKAEILPKYDWYQNQTHVFLSFKVVGDTNLAKSAKVTFDKTSVSIETGEQKISVQLSCEVRPDLCQSFPFSQKLEVKL
jgi:hypothetical protein